MELVSCITLKAKVYMLVNLAKIRPMVLVFTSQRIIENILDIGSKIVSMVWEEKSIQMVMSTLDFKTWIIKKDGVSSLGLMEINTQATGNMIKLQDTVCQKQLKVKSILVNGTMAKRKGKEDKYVLKLEPYKLEALSMIKYRVKLLS